MRQVQDDSTRPFGLLEEQPVPISSVQPAQEPEKHLLTRLDSLPDGVFLIDTEWRYTYLNRQAEQLVRRPREELLGKNVWELFPDAIETAIYTESMKAVQDQQPRQFEVFYPPLKTWFESKIYPSRDGLTVFSRDVTQQRQVEMAFRPTREQLGTVLQNVPNGIILYNNAGEVLFANQWGAQHLGFTSPEEIYTLHNLEAMRQRFLERFTVTLEDGRPFTPALSPIERAYHSETNPELIARIVQKDAQRDQWILARATPLVDEHGSVQTVLSSFTDITTQKKSEEAVRLNEARLRTALHGTQITVYEQDRDLRYTWVYNLVTSTPEEIVGKTDADLVQPEEARQLIEIKQRVLRTGKGEWVELQTTSVAGVRVHDLTVEPLYEGSGNIIGVTGAVIDITERKQAEAELAKYAAIVASSDDAIISKSLDGTITSWNTAAERMFGYTAAEAIGQLITLIIPPELYQEEADIFKQLRQGIHVQHFETVRMRKDGTKVAVSLSISPIKDRAGNILGAAKIARDISEHHELERRKDEFISMASHELKTPITTLKGLTQLLIRKLERQGRQEPVAILTKMAVQIDRLTKLITELLDVSKIQAGRLDYAEEPVDIDALVQETVEMLQPISPTHILTVAGATHATILGDNDRLGQVVTNLITNAIKYSPDADKVDIALNTTNKIVTISVRDYGIGIPKEQQDKVFDRFYRVSNSHDKTFSGLGMGLYIAREIVKRHGGDITVESEEGKGSTFTVHLPRKKEDE